MNNNTRTTSKAVLIITSLCGLAALFLGKLEDPANLGAFALIHVGAILNRIDSRRQGYKASFTAGAVTATLESGAWEYDLPVAADESSAASESDDPGPGLSPGGAANA
jgi:hydrogenase maturation factor